MSLKDLHGIYLFLAKVGRRNNPSHVLDVRRALIYVSEYLPPSHSIMKILQSLFIDYST